MRVPFRDSLIGPDGYITGAWHRFFQYLGDQTDSTNLGVEDNGTTVVSDVQSINFSSNLSVADDGDSTVTVTGADPSNIEKTVIDFAGEYDNGSVGSNTDIDWSNGNNQKITLTADITFTFSNMGVGHKQLKIIQDSTGNRTPTLPTGKWPGGSAGSFSTDAGAEDILSIYYDGSSYYYQLGTGWA